MNQWIQTQDGTLHNLGSMDTLKLNGDEIEMWWNNSESRVTVYKGHFAFAVYNELTYKLLKGESFSVPNYLADLLQQPAETQPA